MPSASSFKPSSLPRLLLMLSLFLSLSACSSVKSWFDFSSDDDVDLQVPVKTLAAKGMDDYTIGRYFTALEYFEEILDKYPFSPEATLAELKAADCNYFMEHYQEALVQYKAFEERHPTNEAIPYVMFQKAMCYYKRIDRIDRDTIGATESIQLFKQLLRAYPDSPYTSEAKAKIRAAQEFLANHEYFVVEFYVRTEKYSEAQSRLKYMLAVYPESTIAPKAKEMLARLDAGDPPKSNFTSWLPKVSLPDWSLFQSEEETEPTDDEAKP